MKMMNTDVEEPLYADESKRIVGCAMRVHNGLGYGFYEKPYENALVVDFEAEGIICEQQKRFEMIYRGKSVGLYIPDLIVFEKIIIDTKTIQKITPIEVGQMMNYLKISGYRLGYILNFKHPRLEWKRVVL